MSFGNNLSSLIFKKTAPIPYQCGHRSLEVIAKKFPFFQDPESPLKPNRALKVIGI